MSRLLDRDTWQILQFKVAKVSAGSTSASRLVGVIRSFRSTKNQTLGIQLNWDVALQECVLIISPVTSIVAPMARGRVFDNRKGVWPGTIAILSFSGPNQRMVVFQCALIFKTKNH